MNVKLIKDGPALLEGSIEVVNEDGTITSIKKAAICRCGKTQGSPFCDGSHAK